MLGRRPLSPSFHAAPRWEPQPGGPGPAKRRRIQEPAGPEHGMAPGLQGPAEPRAAAALTSVVVLAAGCALQLPLDSGFDLRLEPAPTSVLRVRLGGHTLVLVPEALWGAGAGARSPGGLEPGALLDAPGGGVAVQQEFFCAFVPEVVAVPEFAFPEVAAAPEIAVSEIAFPEMAFPEVSVPEMAFPEVSIPEVAAAPEIAFPEIAFPEVALPEVSVPEMAFPEVSVPEVAAAPEIAVPEFAVPEIAIPEEAYDEDEAPGFLTPWMVHAVGLGTHSQGPIREPWPRAPTPSPERRAPGPYYSPDFHLWEPFPSSPLQPLPPSPSPGPQVRPRRPLGPPPKARRRLF
ncbi:unnamed protein product [Pipistrellus nathusii]|uniref:Uncharacterized protein n=1 Tax=Pipistrellus nathusii TaxID=59473 RepID=A0ABN9ZBA7_PIPNA